MRNREIVVLDCGVEIRHEDKGILFTCHDTGREFAFGLKGSEVGDMIVYLNQYLIASENNGSDRIVEPKLSPIEKAARSGVNGQLLADPSSVKTGRVIPQTSVSIHKG